MSGLAPDKFCKGAYLLFNVKTLHVFIGIFLLLCFPVFLDSHASLYRDYRQDMRDLVQEVSAYVKGIDSNFIIIAQNGHELLTESGDASDKPVANYINALDGIGQEGLFYGYNEDNTATPTNDQNYLSGFLDLAENNGVEVLVTDYCRNRNFVDDSYYKNNIMGYISFAANHRELDSIPPYPKHPHNTNNFSITSLAAAKNFLYLINPGAYKSKEGFLKAIQNTDYDIIIADLFYDGSDELTSNDVSSLKVKANGAARLVIAYMSIGEAEDYRYYWQPDWKEHKPVWLEEENPDWPGNYKVHYWDKSWQNIIYGNNTSYMKKIINSGFDGVYLDIIDAFEYFENTGNSTNNREDGAVRLEVPVNGSLQNPAWSPDGNSILFTMFSSDGYNKEPADLLIIDLNSDAIRTIVSDGSANINLPGSTWNPITKQIVFSSSRDPHDEIYIIPENGGPGNEIRITSRENIVSYEPSLSPDGQWIVFESHAIDVEENGVITKYKMDGTGQYQHLTSPAKDCRQPNWSPAGDKIVFQKFSNDNWGIWVMDLDGTNQKKITMGAGDKTDASFSPDGQWIVYSSDESEIEFANLFIIPASGGDSIRITDYRGYDGAPSWSPDGKMVVFESYPGDPDGKSGTSLWIIDVSTPSLLPRATTCSASSLTYNSATLNGTINPNGADTTYYFEYGTTTGYGSNTATNVVDFAAGDIEVSDLIVGLNPNTTYHFRIIAVNRIGTSYGDENSLTTTTQISRSDGDISPLGNHDGIVNIADALLALRFALGLETPTQEDMRYGDVAPLSADGKPNPDGQITAGDALVILRNVLGIIEF